MGDLDKRGFFDCRWVFNLLSWISIRMGKTLEDLLAIYDDTKASLPNSAKIRMKSEESRYFQKKVWNSNHYQNKKIRKKAKKPQLTKRRKREWWEMENVNG
jgi:hypothetical protein